MGLAGKGPQMSRQLELPFKSRGEAPRVERSEEEPSAARGDERSGARLARVTSILRTARCGPACRVVWEGSAR